MRVVLLQECQLWQDLLRFQSTTAARLLGFPVAAEMKCCVAKIVVDGEAPRKKALRQPSGQSSFKASKWMGIPSIQGWARVVIRQQLMWSSGSSDATQRVLQPGNSLGQVCP